MERARRKLLLVVVSLFVVLSGLFCVRSRESIELPFSKDVVLDTPYLVRDYDNLRYILDKQRTRILVVDKRTNCVQTVWPKRGKNADVFSYAESFMVDELGFVYVKDAPWNGNCIAREAVLVYDNRGRYVKTVLDTHYEELVNKPKMMLLSMRGGNLHYAVKEKNSIVIASFDMEHNTEIKKVIPLANAFDFVNDMAEDSAGNVYVLLKTGELFMLNEEKNGFAPVWTCGADDYPNSLEAGKSGELFYTDLYADCVMRLDVRSGEKTPVLSGVGSVMVSPVAFSVLQNPKKSPVMLRTQAATLAALVLFIGGALVLLIFLLVAFFKQDMHIIRRISFYIIAIVIAVSGMITYKLTDEFSKVMKEQLLSQMEVMAQSVANVLSPSALDNIQTAADFASDDYRSLIVGMESVIDIRLKNNRSIYCDILKYDQKHGAYACAYLDQAIGTYFPIPENEAADVRQIYETGRTLYASMDEFSGSFTYVSVPVFAGQGRVCGVVVVLTENYMLTEQINGMKKNVLLGIVVTLIFIWLFMGELLSYILAKSQAQMERQEKESRGEKPEQTFPHYYIRLMVFALFVTYNITTTFLPMVIAKGAFATLGENCGSFLAALPISVNLFVIGGMALFCEPLLRRAGFKRVIAAGAGLSAVSNLLVFFFPSEYYLLVFALVLDGIGVGLSTNAMYLMVSQIPDPKNRSAGYTAYNAAQISGINFGMLFGAALAPNIGRQLVFPVVALCWLLTALLFALLWRSLGIASAPALERTERGEQKEKRIRRTLRFVCHRRVWSYILFAQMPFALMGGFIYYYLPLYSELHGLGEVIVAVLMMLYAMFAIYLGDALTRFVITCTGAFSTYVAVMVSAAAIVVYGMSGTFAGLLIAIILLGLANGFGRSVLQSHFSSLEECEAFGVSEAMGIFNFTDFIGQSFGPAVMGMVFLSKNMGAAATGFAAGILIISVIHFVIQVIKPIKHGV
mgnify:CR=1 FL=1